MKTRLLGILLAILLVSSASPYVAKSSNGGNVAYATLLPVKIEHNEEGEIWQLPNGNYVLKVGGEAPPRKHDDGILLNGTTIQSTMVDVDLVSDVDSEIIYKKDGVIASKESWFIYVNGVKIEWNSITDDNLFIKTIEKQETVGSYLVNDYEKLASKERTMFNDFGSLWMEYKLREGSPLKHTMNFTASLSGKYSVCQEFTEIDHDEIIKHDIDNNLVEQINTLEQKTESVDVLSVDKLSLAKSEKDELKLDMQRSLPELVEFKKDGVLVLGEITTGAKNDFQSFEFDSNSKTAKFCYGEFDLKAGESFLVDPDTYSTNNPTLDGYTGVANSVATTCASTGHSSAKTASSLSVAYKGDSDLSDNCSRGFFEFPLTSLPDAIDVTNTVFKYDIVTASNPQTVDVYAMEIQPSVATDLQLWTDAADGTLLVDDTSAFGTVGDELSLDLGTSADSLIESQVTNGDWFGFGTKFSSETRDSTSSHHIDLEPEEDAGATPKPTLEVTYSLLERDVLVTVNHYRGNTTALTTCNVTLTNSSASETKACNSNGLAGLFTGRSGNHNATVKETTTNIVVNKTRNFSPATNLIINATIVEVNCSQTGSATDIRLWYNQSNVHTMTNMTRPTCNSSNIIHWNGTFSPDGTNSMTGVTDVRIEIRNATAYGKNGIVLYTNGTSQTLSFSNGVITASDITVGSGTGSTKLLKNYLLLDGRPDQVSGTSATGVSTGQIDLAWSTPSSGVTSITGYKIYVSSDGGTTWSILESDTGDVTTTYGHSGLTASSTRHYMIAAINTFGAGTNSTSFSGTTSSAGGNQGGGGGGGGGVTPSNTVNVLSSLSLVSKKLIVIPNQNYLGEIDVVWNSGNDLIVSSVNYGSTQFVLSFGTPITLKGSGESVSNGKLQYNLKSPQKLPDKSYSIPITINAVIDGSEVTQQTTIQIDTLGDTSINLGILVLLIALVPSVFLYRHLTSKKSKKSDLLDDIFNFDKLEKPLKNGSVLKELKKIKP